MTKAKDFKYIGKNTFFNTAAGSQSFQMKTNIYKGRFSELDTKLMVQFISPVHLPAVVLAKIDSSEFETCHIFNIPCISLEEAKRGERLDESNVRKHWSPAII